MTRAFTIAIVLASVGAARAEPPRRALVGLEMGALVSPADGDRRDQAPLGGIAVRWRTRLSDTTTLSLGTAIPVMPFMVGQVTALVEVAPRPAGFAARAGLRPLVGLVGLCGVSGSCPEDEMAEPHDRAGWLVGIAAEVGAGWRFALTETAQLEVIASYVGGVFEGRSRKTETALDGYYQGGLLSVDLTF